MYSATSFQFPATTGIYKVSQRKKQLILYFDNKTLLLAHFGAIVLYVFKGDGLLENRMVSSEDILAKMSGNLLVCKLVYTLPLVIDFSLYFRHIMGITIHI